MLCGVVQMAPGFGRVTENVERARALAREHPADLLVFPELVTSGYRFRDREEALRLAEGVPDGPSVRAFADLARELGTHVCFGFPERSGERLFNSAALVGPEGVGLVYRKAHLFLDEKTIFDPGDGGFPVVDLPGGGARVGILVCFDYIFPEAARTLALGGAEILLHPANLITPFGQRAMETRALENGVFALLANRTGAESRGDEEPLVFSGLSRILGPRGEVLGELDAAGEGVLRAEIDPARARDKGITARNDLFADRRPELYGRLAQRDTGDDS